MAANRITAKHATKFLIVNEAYVMGLAKAGLIPYIIDKKGVFKFRRQDILNLPRRLLLDKSGVSKSKYRPKSIILVIPKGKGKRMESYTRNAKEAINLGSGLTGKFRWILSSMVDLMAVHDNNGIPCDPPTYCAGLLGCGEREWNSVVSPALVAAHKIKRVKRNGVDVWVWHDKNLMAGPRAIVTELVQEKTYTSEITIDWGENASPDYMKAITASASKFMDEMFSRIICDMDLDISLKEDAARVNQGWLTKRLGPEIKNPFDSDVAMDNADVVSVPHADLDQEVAVGDGAKTIFPIPEAEPAPIGAVVDDKIDVTEAKPVEIQQKPASKVVGPIEKSDPIPFPSAIELLTKAGINTVDHPHGEFFWARADHKPTIQKWIDAMGGVDPVLMALHRGVQSGAINPDLHPNRLSVWDDIVMGYQP